MTAGTRTPVAVDGDVTVRRHGTVRGKPILRRLGPWLYLAPLLLFIGLFKAWPLIWGVYLSFFHVRPYLGNEYVGADNYHKLFSDPDLRSAVVHTVLDALLAVSGSILVGVTVADAEHTIDLVRADAEDTEHLRCAAGDPLLRERR